VKPENFIILNVARVNMIDYVRGSIMSKIINISKNLGNYSQRNNEVNPLVSCNTTSMIMAISYIPKLYKVLKDSKIFKFYNKNYKQEEDCLQKMILDFGGDPTLHSDLSNYTNHLLGMKATYFSTSTPMTEVIKDIEKGLPVVISGSFPGYPTVRKDPLGHIVVLVGCEWSTISRYNKGSEPDYYIIDDPYGNTMNDWKGSGNDIKIPSIKFNHWIKETDNKNLKWTHRFIV
jgi:hypothetical protein